MDLQQFLNYRKECFMCGKPTHIIAPDIKKSEIMAGTNNLILKINNKSTIEFDVDGKFVGKNYAGKNLSTIKLNKQCDDCENTWLDKKDIKPILYKPRALGFTTIENIKDWAWYLEVKIYGDAENNFVINKQIETVRYSDKKKNFYNLNINYNEKLSTLCYGNTETTSIDTMGIIHTEVINLSNINNIEDYLKKYNKYILFS